MVKFKFGKVIIGKKIKELRENAGMLQRELAAILDIGEGFLSKVENNQKSLKRADLAKISKLFSVKLEYLETLWLGHKIYDLIKKEAQGIEALKVAEDQVKYKDNE